MVLVVTKLVVLYLPVVEDGPVVLGSMVWTESDAVAGKAVEDGYYYTVA